MQEEDEEDVDFEGLLYCIAICDIFRTAQAAQRFTGGEYPNVQYPMRVEIYARNIIRYRDMTYFKLNLVFLLRYL